MGFSELSRFELYSIAAELILEYAESLPINNPNRLSEIYRASAILIEELESPLLERDSSFNLTYDDADNFFRRAKERVGFSDFVTIITPKIEKSIQGKKLDYKGFFDIVLRKVQAYQREVINKEYNYNGNQRSYMESGFQTAQRKVFLSYAYKDKGLSLALHLYCRDRGVFLFVDWMWNPEMKKGCDIKKAIGPELDRCDDLLFLRTANSELSPKNNSDYYIRHWCAWEIGYFYTKNRDKYYISFYDNEKPIISFLDTMKPMKDVSEGHINEYE